jgi:hypothetical protein
MAISQAQQNIERAVAKKARDERAASIMAQRKQDQSKMLIERNARVKATGGDPRTIGRQMRDEAHQASLKRIYGKDLDTTDPAAVNAARAAKQAAARQTRLDARQVRDAAFAERLAMGEKQAAEQETAKSAPMGAGIGQLGGGGGSSMGEKQAAEQKAAQETANARMNASRQVLPDPVGGGAQAIGGGNPMGGGAQAIGGGNPMGGGAQAIGGGNPMGGEPMRRGGSVKQHAKSGAVKQYAKGGSVSASSRGDGIAQRGKTKGRMC